MRLPRVVDGLREGALSTDYEFSEIQGAILAVLWGAWMLLGAHDVLITTLRILQRTFPLVMWGGIFTAGGIFQAAGLFVGNWKLRRFAIMGAAMTWLFCAALLGLADWRQPTFPILLDFAVGSGWGYLRLGVMERRAEKPRVVYPIPKRAS